VAVTTATTNTLKPLIAYLLGTAGSWVSFNR